MAVRLLSVLPSVFFIVLGLFAVNVDAQQLVATAVISSVDGSGISGQVTFTQASATATEVTISGTITGLTANGEHAFHVHEYGDITQATTGTSTGGHYNPDGKPHACHPTAERHVGDIGNIQADASGAYTFPANFNRDLLTLTGANSIIGRAVVIHAGKDDCAGASGNAGARKAQGVIGIKEGAAVYSGAKARAVAVLKSVGAGTATGTVFFEPQTDGSTRVYARVSGITVGNHGFHVHQLGDISNTVDGTSAGGHYNPAAKNHALPAASATERHMGDMGNLKVEADGKAYHDVTDSLLVTGGAAENIIGRAVVIHADPDDGAGTSGNAGSRVMYGVIGLANPTTVPEVWEAVVSLQGTTGNAVSGDVTFTQVAGTGNVKISGTVTGLADGEHAFHVHTYGDISVADGTGAGGHYNPDNKPHACHPSAERHVGDIGNIVVAGGTYTFPANFERDLLTLTGGKSIVGASVIIHAGKDDCTGASGNAGARVAMGVIGIKKTSDSYISNLATYDGTNNPEFAVAVLKGTNNCAGCGGTVAFKKSGTSDTEVHISLSGFPSSVHAFHIHEFGDITDMTTGGSAGGHYNPAHTVHGLPTAASHHMGDLGNVDFVSGNATVVLKFAFVDMRSAMANILGRGVVVHASNDKGTGASGDAGSRLAAGVIGTASVQRVDAATNGSSNGPSNGSSNGSSNGPSLVPGVVSSASLQTASAAIVMTSLALVALLLAA
eukprot:GFYU01001419.1.p1 GENE.GFYU01001419.1~~GFYU01001419.1.p1  ORF type:complete len:725 (-),score=257.52 GFYU01001419.1:203-2377(-)